MKKFLPILIFLVVSGCGGAGSLGSQKNWLAIDGSKGDGVVTTGYDYTTWDKPPTGNGQYVAFELCSDWGYSKVKASFASTKKCVEKLSSGRCYRQRVEQKFQCIE